MSDSGWVASLARLQSAGSTLRARLIIASMVALFVAIVLGCMNFSIGGRTIQRTADEEPFEQEGKIELGPGAEQVVYYPIPYAQTPNLELDDGLGIELTEQARDHFRVQNTRHGIFGRIVQWKARGLREPPPAPPIPMAPAPSSPLTPSNPPPPPPIPYVPAH